ncbi:proteasomal ubiquitin receptor ADRM1 homolog [Drosophila biarmipes]|uniref:proteasomal ubiquitin receptor ADRM1 homolog n=1 Tax=Drosophila biarmipes TaxID=125945 RepID=UPI0007E70491|nr:proteasomal ubiquitin receptor ADRM1 homolog [Drosophila biarmipes]
MADSQAPNLLQYKVGRMILLGKMIEPDDRKGLLFVRRSAGDNQVHIHWMDRRTGTVELDIPATPGDLEFRRIDQCKTGRVYALKYTRSTQRYFFWMQEPQADRDAEFCERINELIATGARKWDESAAAEGDVDTDVEQGTRHQRGFGGSEHLQVLDQMRQMLENSLARTPETWPPPANQTDEAEEAMAPLAFPDPAAEILDLATVLRFYGAEAVQSLLMSPRRRQKLLAQLPQDPDEQDADEKGNTGYHEAQIILDHLRSPQFYETMSYFSLGLHSGIPRTVLQPVLNNHDHREALDAAQSGDIERFLRVLHRNERDYNGPTD